MLADLRAIQTGTGTGNLTAVTGLGFQPKALLFFSARRGSAGTGASVKVSYGVATGATERACWGFEILDNQATSAVTTTFRDDACCATPHNGGSGGHLDVASIDADGYTLAVDSAFSSDTMVSVLALGGSDLTSAKVVTFQSSNATGNQGVTTPGFLPSFVLLGSVCNTAVNTYVTTGDFGPSLGAMTTTAQWTVAGYSDDAATVRDSSGLISTTRALANLTSAGVLNDWSYVSMDASGFTLNKHTNGNQARVWALCLAGGQYHVGTHSVTASATGNESFTGVGFQGVAGLFAAHPEATSSEGTTPTASHEITVGAAVSSSQRHAMWWGDDDLAGATANTDTNNEHQTTKVFVNRAVAGGATNQGDADHVSWDSDGYTWNRTTAFTNGLLVARAVFGSTATSGAHKLAGKLYGKLSGKV